FFIQDITATIFTGIISSLFFLFILSRLKPRIKICDKIALHVKKNHSTPKYTYYFKVINSSLFFRVYDLNVRVRSSTVRSSPNGDNIVFDEIELKVSKVWLVNRLKFSHLFQDIFLGTKRLKGRTDYAVQFVTNNNLTAAIRGNKCITLQLIAKHSLTGFTRVISMDFKHEEEIVKGNFLSGNTFKISPQK